MTAGLLSAVAPGAILYQPRRRDISLADEISLRHARPLRIRKGPRRELADG
jgi:hypothetical protein